MSNIFDKYNRTHEETRETYDVVRKKLSEVAPNVDYLVKYVGTYESEQYGNSVYVDYVADESYGTVIRSSLPKRMYDTVKAMTADTDVIDAINAGIVYINFHPFKTKSGFTTYDVKWKEKELPF